LTWQFIAIEKQTLAQSLVRCITPMPETSSVTAVEPLHDGTSSERWRSQSWRGFSQLPTIIWKTQMETPSAYASPLAMRVNNGRPNSKWADIALDLLQTGLLHSCPSWKPACCQTFLASSPWTWLLKWLWCFDFLHSRRPQRRCNPALEVVVKNAQTHLRQT